MKTCIDCGKSTPEIKMSGHNKRCDTCIAERRKKPDIKEVIVISETPDSGDPIYEAPVAETPVDQEQKERRVKSLQNGRIFIWTPALGRRRDMIEI